MKIIFLALSLMITTVLSAQSKATPAKNKGGTQSSAGTCYADKKWKLSKVEKFGQEKDPPADMKNDFLMLKGDGTFTLMYKGIYKAGTYTKGGTLQLKMLDGSETWAFKVMSCDGTSLKTDYKDGDTHNVLTYKAE